MSYLIEASVLLELATETVEEASELVEAMLTEVVVAESISLADEVGEAKLAEVVEFNEARTTEELDSDETVVMDELIWEDDVLLSASELDADVAELIDDVTVALIFAGSEKLPGSV